LSKITAPFEENLSSLQTLKTGLPGVIELRPKIFRDSRGFFLERYNSKRFAELGIADHFVQGNQLCSLKGTLEPRSLKMKSLNTKAWVGLVFLIVVMGLILFLSAGTIFYWQAWAYLAVSFGASLLTTLYLRRYDPALLARRVSAGPTAEKEKPQAMIVFFTSLGFIALLNVPGLDNRFGWSAAPPAVAILGEVLVLAGFYIIFLVYKENTFASARIEIAKDQRVISTGPYAIVRHPMYGGGLLLMIGTPIALGSYWGLLAFAAMSPFLLWRILAEEQFLSTNLPGYTEYRAKVPWRLIPRFF
jgi:protein-S-isoprenylcysteine O-methyltransferase Ste14